MHQSIQIIGNVGKDAQMRYTADGTPVTSFTVAVNKKWDGGESTTWFKIACWRRLAEVCNEYVRKGRLVFIEGEIDCSAWADRDGNPQATLELTARNVTFLGGKGDAQSEAAPVGPDGDNGREALPF